MALPANVSFGTVTGRFLTATADAPADADRDPEGSPATDLSIRFAPNITPAVVRDASSTPPTIFALAEIPATVNPSGDLIGPDGQPGIRLVATTGTTIDPSGWTWKVTLSSTTFPALSFSFALDPGQTIDLATVVQVPASPGASLAAWLQAVADANAAADRAETAAAAATAGGGGGASDATIAGYVADPATATGAAIATRYLPKAKTPITTRLAGTLIGFAGDSITQGTGASTTSNIYVTQTEKILGAHASRSSINAGVAGERSDQILARIDGIIASGAQFLHVLAGTNDAGQSVPLTTFQANIRAIKAKADAAGLPIVFSLVPPRSATQGATIAGYVRQYNLFLRFWGNTNGVPIVDTFKAVADPTTGYLAAVNDSGDGVHPSDAGHAAIAAALAAVLLPLLPLPSWPVVAAGQGLCTDPLMTNRSGTWPAWSISAGPQFPSLSLVPSVNGDLPAGGWLRFTLSNGASGGQSSVSCQLNPAGWAAGDVLLICAYFRASSVEASPKVQLANQNGASAMVLADPAPTATPGPIIALYTVPTSGTPTDLALQLVIKSRPGQTDTIDVGAADVFNLTRLGLADGSITV